MPTLDQPGARADYAEREDLPRMSFGDHLDELRKRLLRSVIAIVAAILAMVPFHDQVMAIIIEPYRILWRQGFELHCADWERREQAGELRDPLYQPMLKFTRENKQAILAGTFPVELAYQIPLQSGYRVPYELVAAGGVEDIWTFMMASFVFALVLASPVVVWQIWAFIAAGLYQRERRVFYRYFPFMMVLLASGVLFGYFMAVPYGLGFLIRLQVPGLVNSMLTVGNFFTFLFALTAALGLVFQLPLVMVALQRIGLVRHRTYLKQWRISVMVIFALAALLTPPDPFSMMMMALPTLGLYGLGLVLTAFGRRHERPDAPAVAAP